MMDAEPRPAVSLVSAALWYAGFGLPIFPLSPGTKVPTWRSKGLTEATTDPDRIRSWWFRLPTANIAIATGHGADVIDVDGPLGVQSWARLEDMPAVVGVVSTPRPGGTHLYVRSTGNGNRAAMLPGIDFRGLGGYVVVPPSVITPGPDVPHPGPYRWRRPLLDLRARRYAAATGADKSSDERFAGMDRRPTERKRPQ